MVVLDLLRLTPVTGIGSTVIVQSAVMPPSMVVAVIIAVPTATAVTSPVSETVAVFVSLLVQVTSLFVALSGSTVAISCSVPPTTRDMLDLIRVTPVTAMSASVPVTVTLQLADTAPSCVLTVIIASPGDTAVAIPVEETVTTDSWEELYVNS